jgi:hypothetical protein
MPYSSHNCKTFHDHKSNNKRFRSQSKTKVSSLVVPMRKGFPKKHFLTEIDFKALDIPAKIR